MRHLILGALLTAAGCVRGASDYNRGVEAFHRKDYPQARRHFEKAVGSNSEFAEAWFNLGATKVYLAKAALRSNQRPEALALYREGVEHLRKSKALMDQGRFTVYSEANERERIRKEAEDRLREIEPLAPVDELVISTLQLLEE